MNYRPFLFWCQKVLPLVYDESLSYYELLCKVVHYINGLLADAKLTQEKFDAVEAELAELRKMITDLQINKLITQEVEAALDKMVEDGTLADLLDTVVNGTTDQFQAQRMFRTKYEIDHYGAQSFCCTGSSWLFLGGHGDSSEYVTIRETSMTGQVLRTVYRDGTALGHCNGSAFYNGKIYVARGGINHVIVVDYETLNIESVIEVSGLSTCHGIDFWNGTCYLAGRGTDYGSATERTDVFTLNLETGEATRILVHQFPKPTNSFSMTIQNIAVYGGYVYFTCCERNYIEKVSLESGAVIQTWDMGDGDGFYPYCEVESGKFVDGQLYIMTAASLSASAKTKMFAQVFKTNIGGVVNRALPYVPNAIPSTYSIYIDPTAGGTNPDGTDDNPFNSVEEACIVHAYLSRCTIYGVYRFYVNNASGFDDNPEAVKICRDSVAFSGNNVVLKAVNLYDGDFTFTNCTVEGIFYAQNAVVHCNNVGGGELQGASVRFGVNNPSFSEYSLTRCNIDFTGVASGWDDATGSFTNSSVDYPCLDIDLVPTFNFGNPVDAYYEVGSLLKNVLKTASRAGAGIQFDIRVANGAGYVRRLDYSTSEITNIFNGTEVTKVIEVITWNNSAEKLLRIRLIIGFNGSEFRAHVDDVLDVIGGGQNFDPVVHCTNFKLKMK